MYICCIGWCTYGFCWRFCIKSSITRIHAAMLFLPFKESFENHRSLWHFGATAKLSGWPLSGLPHFAKLHLPTESGRGAENPDPFWRPSLTLDANYLPIPWCASMKSRPTAVPLASSHIGLILGLFVLKPVSTSKQAATYQRTKATARDGSIAISRAPAGIAPVTSFPPGHRTRTCVGEVGVPNTCTTLSWDQ